MTKGIPAQELLADMARQLRSQGALDLTLTLAPRKRRRKNRWHTVKGKVVGVRFTDDEYELVQERAKALGLSAGSYLKQLAAGATTRRIEGE